MMEENETFADLSFLLPLNTFSPSLIDVFMSDLHHFDNDKEISYAVDDINALNTGLFTSECFTSSRANPPSQRKITSSSLLDGSGSQANERKRKFIDFSMTSMEKTKYPKVRDSAPHRVDPASREVEYQFIVENNSNFMLKNDEPKKKQQKGMEKRKCKNDSCDNIVTKRKFCFKCQKRKERGLSLQLNKRTNQNTPIGSLQVANSVKFLQTTTTSICSSTLVPSITEFKLSSDKIETSFCDNLQNNKNYENVDHNIAHQFTQEDLNVLSNHHLASNMNHITDDNLLVNYPINLENLQSHKVNGNDVCTPINSFGEEKQNCDMVDNFFDIHFFEDEKVQRNDNELIAQVQENNENELENSKLSKLHSFLMGLTDGSENEVFSLLKTYETVLTSVTSSSTSANAQQISSSSSSPSQQTTNATSPQPISSSPQPIPTTPPAFPISPLSTSPSVPSSSTAVPITLAPTPLTPTPILLSTNSPPPLVHRPFTILSSPTQNFPFYQVLAVNPEQFAQNNVQNQSLSFENAQNNSPNQLQTSSPVPSVAPQFISPVIIPSPFPQPIHSPNFVYPTIDNTINNNTVNNNINNANYYAQQAIYSMPQGVVMYPQQNNNGNVTLYPYQIHPHYMNHFQHFTPYSPQLVQPVPIPISSTPPSSPSSSSTTP